MGLNAKGQCAASDTLDLSDADVLGWLDHRAKTEGGGRYAHAAGILRGRPGGRPAIDDRPSLIQMAWLLEHGEASSVDEAAKLVAATYGSSCYANAIRVRLSRKYRREKHHIKNS